MVRYLPIFTEALQVLKAFRGKKNFGNMKCFCLKKISKFIIVITNEKGNIEVLVEKEMKRKLDYALPAFFAN